jgi:uncharacterized protein
MRQDKTTGRLQLSATDLSNFLGCHHRTALEMATAAGRLTRPPVDDPQLEALFKRGLDHEAVYVESLKTGGTNRVVEIAKGASREAALAETVAAMHAGADVIVQGALGNARWYGRPDVLRKAAGTSKLGGWSYEVIDTKLARETKAGTILQLALYCSLLEDTLGQPPELFHVVTPDNTEPYRLADYAAYFRLQRARLEASTEEDDVALATANYPEPVDHCDICPWSGRCNAQRRKDDHLSIVAGISRTQRRELVSQQIATMASLAAMPIKPLTFRPKRGAAETYERIREQARLQIEARTRDRVFEMLDVVAEQGLCRLPEPSPGDIFLDLEGDPFAGPVSGPPMLRGREYLFGVVSLSASDEPAYQALWAENEAEEKTAFQAVIDQIVRAKAKYPGAHVYHYAPYEPSAFKRLMGRHATREQEIDALLRSETFVDLYAVVRQSLRAGVERYSIKNMEPLYGFVRDVNLRDARRHLQAMEIALEQNRLGDLLPEVRVAVEGYNRDDCVSTLRLRNWLEEQRATLIAKGQAIARPELKSGEPSKPLDERQQKVEALRGQLLGVDDPARRVLAYLLDFHRREDKAAWWEYFRLIELSDEDLLDERGAVSGLEYVEDVRPEKRSVIQRYRYPPQEMELRRGDELKLTDQTKWADVVGVDRAARTIDVKVGKRQADRPTAAFAHKHISPKAMEDAIYAIGESLLNGAADPLAIELLYRKPPTTRVATQLKDTVLAIQGPPGTGKTYTGGKMICDLVAAGKKVGIAATGHKVIRNLLDAVAKEAARPARDMSVTLAHRGGSDDASDDEDAGTSAVIAIDSNEEALEVLQSGAVNVLGGTAWLWARPEFRKSVDVLFIDEAGQMSLANALAITPAAGALVLLGDPQQLDQPTKGTHPDGVGVSALEHILGPHKTMPEEQGMFLAETWRFGDPICEFTSEVFYEGKLRPTSEKDLNRQQLTGGPIDGAGLFVVDVEHDGNRNGSDEEVAVVERLVDKLLAPGSQWIDDKGETHQMTARDMLVVSPYNVQVGRLQERLAARGVEAGTVDKFQGRQAPVVIYSMATSRPEDAPRGMEFLYSLNRLNVATSRAKCAAIVVASPRLMEPECRNPGQMRLANALCRFRELARLMYI